MKLKRNSRIFLLGMVYTLTISIIAAGFVFIELLKVGGPYSIDSSGCTSMYASNGFKPECLNRKAVERAERLAIASLLVSIAMGVALYRTERIRRANK